MKMVKSLLLVSAAGLVAVSGAQAADLPVKAKPVEYVKVCSLYGAGFYYVPGTDICLKIGAYVRYQADNNVSSITAGPFAGGNIFNNRVATQDAVAQRVRTLIWLDSRQQTAYGTLRMYTNIGWTKDNNSNAGAVATAGIDKPMYANRAFIQLAGFTAGMATSYFDFVSTAAVAYNAGFTHAPDTGDGGQVGFWYTAQLGNGVSGTVGIEQSRRNVTVYGPTGFALGTNVGFPIAAGFPDTLGPATAQASNRPDIVANLRVDQAWGSAQVSGALHDASGGYYGTATGPGPGVGGGVGGLGIFETNGHPDSKWGWAVSGGVKINFPMFGPGDYFQGAAVYSEGAVRFASVTPLGGNVNAYFNGGSLGFGQAPDSIFGGNATNTALVGANPAFAGPGGGPLTDNKIHLTTAWSLFASYEHFWTPSLRTSLYGSYLAISYDGQARALMCASANVNLTGVPGAVVPPGGLSTALGGTFAGCNPDWQSWNIGSRSQWNITKDFYIGVDTIYSKLETATLNGPFAFNTGPVAATTLPSGIGGGAGQGFFTTGNQNVVTTTFRVHRDIVP
jgi:hypothetical protein